VCSWIAAAVTIFVSVFALLPAFQPFQPTPFLLSTLVAWKAATWSVVLPVWVAWVGLSLAASAGAVTGRGLASGAALLALAIGGVLYVQKNQGGGLDAADSGELALCVDWCGSPFKPCEDTLVNPNLDTANTSTPGIAANAVAFFTEYVHGPMPVPMSATMVNATTVILTVNGTMRYPYTVENAGSDTLLLAVDKNPISRPGVVGAAVKIGWSAINVLVGDTNHPAGDSMSPPYFGYGMLAENAAVLMAIAKAVQGRYRRVVAYGCSVGGKIAYWAIANLPPGVITDALIDSGGALGPASFKAVGPCGETFAAMVGRHGNWLVANASRTPHPREWPYDVGDLILDACHTTHFQFGVSRYDQWNNWVGTIATAERARAGGCTVNIVEGYRSHCGHFFGPGSCTQRCDPPT